MRTIVFGCLYWGPLFREAAILNLGFGDLGA